MWLVCKIFEFRDRNVGEDFEYVEHRNGRLKLDLVIVEFSDRPTKNVANKLRDHFNSTQGVRVTRVSISYHHLDDGGVNEAIIYSKKIRLRVIFDRTTLVAYPLPHM